MCQVMRCVNITLFPVTSCAFIRRDPAVSQGHVQGRDVFFPTAQRDNVSFSKIKRFEGGAISFLIKH